MRFLRVTFVLLIVVGVCGALYVALTAGLAAYLRYQAGGPAAEPATPAAAAPGSEKPAAVAANASAAPEPAAGPPAGVEDAASLHGRTWTAPRAGLTVPPPFADAPAAARPLLVPTAGPRAYFPLAVPTPVAKTAPVEARLKSSRRPADAASAGESASAMPELALGYPSEVKLPAAPAARVASDDPAVVRASSVGVPRGPDRPAVGDDPTAAAGEQHLLGRPTPPKPVAAPPERMSIPDPAPNAAGDVTTSAPDDDAPAGGPDRPAAIKLPAK